ncbi:MULTISPECIES: hypothetical protein [Flavobacterium]|uniref:Uncharacterized protein n=1 Tax=Flavobacterium piscisymbiosum TaxID=2893753 RepID=A0ABS8M8L0_9FLAO|nr:hypothetical protein [Flavobacterium sp. F-30]MCC9061843.1 hypothetical protein [Flavobacterium sp. F-30]
MTELAKIGKKQTLFVFICILIISLYSTYIYQSYQSEIDIKNLISGITRFFLTIGLLYLVYIGKKWAKVVTIVLFSIANVILIISLFSIDISLINKAPIIIMTVVYSFSLYHFTISKSFKAFFEYQNNKNTDVIS